MSNTLLAAASVLDNPALMKKPQQLGPMALVQQTEECQLLGAAHGSPLAAPGLSSAERHLRQDCLSGVTRSQATYDGCVVPVAALSAMPRGGRQLALAGHVAFEQSAEQPEQIAVPRMPCAGLPRSP